MENMDQVNPQGNQDQQDQPSLGWRAALPDEFKEHEFVKDCQKPGDFVKRAIETKTDRDTLKAKLENSIQKPGEGATPEEIAAFNKALGVPDKPEDYKFEKPKDLPEGLTYQDNVVQWWAQIAHKVGLPENKAKAIFEEYNKLAIDQYNQQAKELADKVEKENATAQTALKEKWGSEYDKNKEFAVRVVKQFGGETFGQKVIELGLGNEPSFLEFMVSVGKAFKDDTMADLTMGQPKVEAKPGQLTWSYPSMPG